jgi:hypothetical protein
MRCPADHAQLVGQRVACHLKQPGAGVVHRAKPLALAQGLEKKILQQVISFRDITQSTA